MSNAKSLFITATGTDIGKTYVSALIVKKMREFGFNCGYYKPVLSGAIKTENGLVPGDCKFVVDTSGLDINPMDCLSYCFEEAVSPHLAAKRLGVNIDLKKIKSDYENLSSKYDYMLIEGAGGITCPLTADKGNVYLLSDLVNDMDFNTVVVADGGLGTINSVLTTVEYMNNRNIHISGIILNNFVKNDFMHKDNLDMVEKLTGLKVIAVVSKDDENLNIEKRIIESLFE